MRERCIRAEDHVWWCKHGGSALRRARAKARTSLGNTLRIACLTRPAKSQQRALAAALQELELAEAQLASVGTTRQAIDAQKQQLLGAFHSSIGSAAAQLLVRHGALCLALKYAILWQHRRLSEQSLEAAVHVLSALQASVNRAVLQGDSGALNALTLFPSSDSTSISSSLLHDALSLLQPASSDMRCTLLTRVQAAAHPPFCDLARPWAERWFEVEEHKLRDAFQHVDDGRGQGLVYVLLVQLQSTAAQLRHEVLQHYMARLVRRHLAVIKARLWRPEGRLVQRQHAAAFAADRQE